MNELLNLLKDGNSRSIEDFAQELNTTIEDIVRRIEFLEHVGMIRRIFTKQKKCASCSSCSLHTGKTCPNCLPEGGFKNMCEMWEVVNP